jgi:hypothetical protein
MCAARAVSGAIVLALAALGVGASAAVATDADATLLRRVPPSFRSTCRADEQVKAPGRVAAVTCKPVKGASGVVYVAFHEAKQASRYYALAHSKLKVPSDTESDCASFYDSESPYRTMAGSVGRVFCSRHRHEHTIAWTDARIVAIATGDDDDSLYTWWAHLVGRTLNPTQRALLAQLPGGIDRASCADNGDASIKCADPMDDVYVVRYTRYEDANALAAAYGSLIAKAGLSSNIAPPDEGSCSYETNWGFVDENGAITQELGRLACYEKGYLPYLLWTQDNGIVLTEAEGGNTGALQAFFHTYATARPPASS